MQKETALLADLKQMTQAHKECDDALSVAIERDKERVAYTLKLEQENATLKAQIIALEREQEIWCDASAQNKDWHSRIVTIIALALSIVNIVFGVWMRHQWPR